ncbi:TVP38/TMEM64 family protein [Evansella sp. AB-P1]|uniref:TVP38/TMEM64 family protein n=1 Tax=Evansella sp. AB-P1 TaxID=3037653 RepID=UPI00241DEC58|nr:TVP38/TMEM64 family protein [Evansella sp. AB-P1]MDG5789649.1 TVP38/TMEM64 family protein [Evansella sp. AB-P1]
MPIKFFIKLVIFAIFIFCILWINHMFLDLNAQEIRYWVLSYGWWAPIVFITLFAFRPFVFFPASILAIAGGLSFGAILGPIVTYIGSLSGAIISFLAVRKIGGEKIHKRWKGKGETLQRKIEENGFKYVLVLRIIPVINFDFVSYLSGLSRIEFKKYLGATMIGIIPGTIVFNLIGATFVVADLQMVMVTGTVFILAIIMIFLIRRKVLKGKWSFDMLTDEKI